jgi:hypothetical protein
LGGTDSDVRLGNFIGDSIKGNQLNRYPEGVAEGIRFHRWVDHFADSHPIALDARAALRSRLDRLAPVGVDMLYDHFLAKNFNRCCPDLPSLAEYAQHVMLDLEGRCPCAAGVFSKACGGTTGWLGIPLNLTWKKYVVPWISALLRGWEFRQIWKSFLMRHMRLGGQSWKIIFFNSGKSFGAKQFCSLNILEIHVQWK